jgi:hypothetical protein
VICVALVVPACKDHELKKLASVRDEVCACKTVQCADAAMGKLPTKSVSSTPKSQQIARAMLDCLADLYQAQPPTLDPDAESGSEPEAAPPAPPAPPAPAASTAGSGGDAIGSARPTGR